MHPKKYSYHSLNTYSVLDTATVGLCILLKSSVQIRDLRFREIEQLTQSHKDTN